MSKITQEHCDRFKKLSKKVATGIEQLNKLFAETNRQYRAALRLETISPLDLFDDDDESIDDFGASIHRGENEEDEQ